MDEPQITPEMQAKLQKLQALSQQLQSIGGQKQQMEMLRNEAQRAHKSLDELGDDEPVYRTVGSLLVKDTRAAALERLSDEMDTLEIRIKRFAQQEESMKAEFDELQEELQKAFGAA